MKEHAKAKGRERESVEVDVDAFRISPGERVRLARRPTRIEPLYRSKKDYERRLEAGTGELIRLQRLLYAQTATRCS